MEKREFLRINPMWVRVGAFLSMMFFSFLADATLSDFVPGFIQMKVGSPLLMGIIFSTSSMAGLILDFLFAQLFHGATVKRMIVYSIIGGLGFAGCLFLATVWPWILLLIMAMVVWGIYYEFFGFSQQIFVSEVAPKAERSAVWSVMMTIRSLAYVLGPLAAQWLARYGDRVVIATAFAGTLISFGVFVMMRYATKPAPVELTEINLWKELSHWRVLFVHIWPMIVLGVVLGIVDAVFWTTGTVVNDQLAQTSQWGGFFVSTYMIPSLLVGVVFMKWKVAERKKRWAEFFVLISGVILACIQAIPSVVWYLAVVFCSSFLNGLAWPLIDAVYTDLLVRMGRERKHLVGMTSSTMSFSYIVGPILAGAVAGWVGELKSFNVLGVFVVVVSLVLLATTPRKLKLPQAEIAAWE